MKSLKKQPQPEEEQQDPELYKIFKGHRDLITSSVFNPNMK